MQETTNPVSHDQTATAVPADPCQAAAVEVAGAAVQAAAEQAAQDEAAARTAADKTLQAAVKAYKAGEKAYRAGLLDSGRLADEYLHQRMALGDKRRVAVQAAEGELAKWSSSAVDVGRLVHCYHAYLLLAQPLADSGDKASKAAVDWLPYGHIRDCWCRLVERTAKDTTEESWTLLPGMEAECAELFKTATAARLSKEATAEKVQSLVNAYAQRQAAETKAAAEGKAAAEKAAKEAAAKAREETAAQQKAADEAAKAAEAAKDADKAALTAAAEQAKADLVAKQKAEAEAHAKAEAEARDKARADREAKEAQAAAVKAAQRAADAAQTAEQRKAARDERKAAAEGNDKPQERATHAPNLLATAAQTAKAATAKDWAEMVAGCLLEHAAPDDVVEALIGRLADNKDLSKPTQRILRLAAALLAADANAGKAAVDAAQLALTRKQAPAPVQAAAPSVNGAPVTAAA